MDAMLNELIIILEQQNKTLSAMLEAAGEHNSALRENDSAAIIAAVVKQEELSQTLRKQDKNREQVQQKLATRFNLKEHAILNDILTNTGESTADLSKLKLAAEKAKDIINQLNKLVSINQVLAVRGMQFTSQMLNIIMPNNANTYMGSGEFRNDRKSKSAINKTI